MKRLNKIIGMVATLLAASVLSGCGLKEFVHTNDSRYGVPGVFDTPLNPPFRTHLINNFLDQYRITHQWTYKGCSYASYAIPIPGAPKGLMSPLWGAFDVLEHDGKTLQRIDSAQFRDMSQYFRETYTTPAPISANGRITYSPDVVRTQPGFRPLCTDIWMASHHSISFSILKREMSDHKARLTRTFPEAIWRIEQFNGLTWHVQQLPLERVRPVPVNAVGGNYANWLTPIGDTDYFINIHFGANQRSFENPATHQAIEALFMRIVQSVTIEPLHP
jgi:hypothetical protein